jgi:hypothetical protein
MAWMSAHTRGALLPALAYRVALATAVLVVGGPTPHGVADLRKGTVSGIERVASFAEVEVVLANALALPILFALMRSPVPAAAQWQDVEGDETAESQSAPAPADADSDAVAPLPSSARQEDSDVSGPKQRMGPSKRVKASKRTTS